MKVWSGSAWAEKPAKVWSGSAWVAKPVKVWDGSAWVTKPPVGPVGPTASLIASYTPGPDRNDFTGEVGVRYGIATPVTISWIGVHCNTPVGTRKINLYEWFGDTKDRAVTIDLAGKTVGSWVWAPIAPLTMAAGSYYALMQEVTASDGLNWDNAVPPATVTCISAVANVYACYRVPASGLSAYGPGVEYVGLDLGW